MRIKELRVSNFRNFDEEVVIVPRIVYGMDLVVLIGENNVGKTSLLSILHLVFNPERSIRTLEFQEADFYDIEKPIQVRITFSNLSEELLSHFVGLVDPEVVDGEELWTLPLVFTCSFDKNTNETDPTLVYGRQTDRTLSFADKRLISFYYQDAHRDYRAIKSGKGSLFGRILNQIDLAAEEQVILGKLDEAGAALNDNSDITKFIKGIAEVTSQIIELPKGLDSLRLIVAASSALDIKKHIQLQLMQNGDRYLNIEQLGLGLQSVLTVSVFRSFAGIGRLREGIFAIDEPEAHLYPHSQRALFRELMQLSRMRQVWVATHSPSLLEWINPRQICMVRKNVEGKSICIQLAPSFPEAHISSYEKHLDVGKADAFFAKAVLLVEGPTEQGLLPALGIEYSSSSQHYDLDRIGISVINAGGKNNIKAMIKLLENFGIPSVAVIDFDAKDKKHETELEELKAISANVYELPRAVDMGDIEGYVCLHSPVTELVRILEEALPQEKIEALIADLKGAINRFNAEQAEQFSAEIRAGATLSACVSIILSVAEAEIDVRKALAKGLRKIKGRTSGRLMGERLHAYFPKEFVENTLDRVITLAGYSVAEVQADKEDSHEML
ncbi:AAA family ATPase [Paenibacillus sp. LHD-38]|uniref:ATP-dependent nuclease n=1 Tax=Paenibacillus sp. LHD-38 TaxID=3072143 RepID=UPI00280DF560|nr:AAA family ATPase [Paenibacillus sp. LHD-38]MDQ8734206.1 AAA family ATPase [Paenibacillus sp. LHD-38]